MVLGVNGMQPQPTQLPPMQPNGMQPPSMPMQQLQREEEGRAEGGQHVAPRLAVVPQEAGVEQRLVQDKDVGKGKGKGFEWKPKGGACKGSGKKGDGKVSSLAVLLSLRGEV